MFLQSNVQSLRSLGPLMKNLWHLKKLSTYALSNDHPVWQMLEFIYFFQNAPVDSIFDLGVRYLVYALVIPPNLTW